MRIGIDLGGTKIEGILIAEGGLQIDRQRVDTPQGDYNGTLQAIVSLVEALERQAREACTIGIGMPGAISRVRNVVKNANSVCLNDRPFALDLSNALGREVRCTNDANCLAVSEATDGAGGGKRFVFAAILGTGCGAGISVDGRVHEGPNRVAGEWGHNGLPWPREDELPGPRCYCGRTGCIETWVSGTGLQADHEKMTGQHLSAIEIIAQASKGETSATASLYRYEDRLARALAQVVNLLDPDIIVLGGGMSNFDPLYSSLASRVRAWTFGGEMETPIVKAKHGDSSGVRGAAWLW